MVYLQDSPLIKAAQNGHILVIDEADKAPLEVVCVLKGLLEDGEMLLSDGRRILGPRAIATPTSSDIRVKDGFQLIVLANRPGFPFLGNDFFREVGDIFSVICVDNLDQASEISLLKSYGPSVSDDLLHRLTCLFKVTTVTGLTQLVMCCCRICVILSLKAFCLTHIPLGNL